MFSMTFIFPLFSIAASAAAGYFNFIFIHVRGSTRTTADCMNQANDDVVVVVVIIMKGWVGGSGAATTTRPRDSACISQL